MEPISFEDFKIFYANKHYLPIGISCSNKHILNEKELKTKYKIYLKKCDKPIKSNLPDYQEDWEVCREKVYKRDNYKCRLWETLNNDEKSLARDNGYFNGWASKISPAHIIPRSKDKDLICEVDNVVTLCLLFHGRMEEGQHPLTGDFIGKDQVYNEWWKRILPKEIFEKYKNKY